MYLGGACPHHQHHHLHHHHYHVYLPIPLSSDVGYLGRLDRAQSSHSFSKIPPQRHNQPRPCWRHTDWRQLDPKTWGICSILFHWFHCMETPLSIYMDYALPTCLIIRCWSDSCMTNQVQITFQKNSAHVTLFFIDQYWVFCCQYLDKCNCIARTRKKIHMAILW